MNEEDAEILLRDRQPYSVDPECDTYESFDLESITLEEERSLCANTRALRRKLAVLLD